MCQTWNAIKHVFSALKKLPGIGVTILVSSAVGAITSIKPYVDWLVPIASRAEFKVYFLIFFAFLIGLLLLIAVVMVRRDLQGVLEQQTEHDNIRRIAQDLLINELRESVGLLADALVVCERRDYFSILIKQVVISYQDVLGALDQNNTNEDVDRVMGMSMGRYRHAIGEVVDFLRSEGCLDPMNGIDVDLTTLKSSASRPKHASEGRWLELLKLSHFHRITWMPAIESMTSRLNEQWVEARRTITVRRHQKESG